MEFKKYYCYYISDLLALPATHPSIKRKIQTLQLIESQKANFIYTFRKKRARHRTDINCIYLIDIEKYCLIMPTKYKETDCELSCVIIDDKTFEEKIHPYLFAKTTYVFKDAYSEVVHHFYDCGETLEHLNEMRSIMNVPLCSEQEFYEPHYLRYLTLPVGMNN